MKDGKRGRNWRTTQRHCGKFSRRAAEAVGLSLASEKPFPKTWKVMFTTILAGVCRKSLCCLLLGRSFASWRQTRESASKVESLQ